MSRLSRAQARALRTVMTPDNPHDAISPTYREPTPEERADVSAGLAALRTAAEIRVRVEHEGRVYEAQMGQSIPETIAYVMGWELGGRFYLLSVLDFGTDDPRYGTQARSTLDGQRVDGIAWQAWSARPEHGGEHFGTVLDRDFPVAVGNLLREALLLARLRRNAHDALDAKVAAWALHVGGAGDVSREEEQRRLDVYARAAEALVRAEEYLGQYLATGISPAALDAGKERAAGERAEREAARAKRWG